MTLNDFKVKFQDKYNELKNQKVEFTLFDKLKPKSVISGSGKKIVFNNDLGKFYIFEKDTLVDFGSKIDKNGYYVSFIGTKEVISQNVSVPESIAPDEMDDMIMNIGYETLSLDDSVSYKLAYFDPSKENTNRENMTTVFATEESKVAYHFKDISDRGGFIDYIYLAPLVFEILYKQNVLPTDKVQLFIYIMNSDAFVVTYRNGKYLYSRSIRYSLDYLYSKFTSDVKQIDKDEFITILKNESYQHTEYGLFFNSIFEELFISMGDISRYLARVFDCGTFDTIYISTVFGDIGHINEFTLQNFNLEVHNFDFEIGIKSIEHIDWLTKLIFLYDKDDDNPRLNFSVFHRPPSIFDMESSKFMMFCGVGVAISIMIPIYFLAYGYIIDYQQNKLSTVYKHKMQQVENLRNEQEAVTKAKEKVQKDISDVDAILDKKSKIINEVLEKSRERRYISHDIFRIVDFINRHHINAQKIEFKKNTITISLVSQKDLDIANLIKDLSLNSGFQKIFSKTIYKDNLTNTYFCDVDIMVNNE